MSAAVAFNEDQAARSRRALEAYPTYRFRPLDALRQLYLVTSPEDREYRTTPGSCSCFDSQRRPALICKHREMLVIHLSRGARTDDASYPLPEWLLAAEACPRCGGEMTADTEYVGGCGYLTRYACGACGHVRLL